MVIKREGAMLSRGRRRDEIFDLIGAGTQAHRPEDSDAEFTPQEQSKARTMMVAALALSALIAFVLIYYSVDAALHATGLWPHK